MNREQKNELVEDIYNSYINGVFSQAHDQIREALEKDVDFSDFLEQDSDSSDIRYSLNNKFVNFVWRSVAKILAFRDSSLIQDNVIKW
jgi:hypothetical protein